MRKFFEVVGKIAYNVMMLMWTGWAITIIPNLIKETNEMRELPFNGVMFLNFIVIGTLSTILVYEVKRFIKLWEGPNKTNIRVFFNGEEVDADIKTEKA